MLTQFLSTALMSLSLATGVKTSNISYDTNYELVYNKINSIYDNPSITNIEDIYNLVGENRYLKVDIYNDYYIIDKEDYKIIDNGLLSNDPYQNYTGLKLYLDSNSDYRYLGLANNIVYDINSGYVFDFNTILTDYNKCLHIPTWDDYDSIKETNDFYYGDMVYCDNHFYFEKIHNFVSDNTQGECPFVAYEMLLSYYDTFLNDNIVDEKYEHHVMEYKDNIEEFIQSPGSGYCNRVAQLENMMEYDDGINGLFYRDIYCSQPNDLLFQKYLINLYDSNYKMGTGLKGYQHPTMIKNYLKTKGFNYTLTYSNGGNLSDVFTNYTIKIIKKTLNAGRPLIAATYNHTMVAYAYNEDYLYLNTGVGFAARLEWKYFKSVLENFYIYDANAYDVKFNMEHIHSDNYYSTKLNSSICPCGELHNHNIEHVCIDNSYHINLCECGINQIENHHYVTDFYIERIYISFLKKYIELPVITGLHCDICNHEKEEE